MKRDTPARLSERPRGRTPTTPSAGRTRSSSSSQHGWRDTVVQPPWKAAWRFLIKLNVLVFTQRSWNLRSSQKSAQSYNGFSQNRPNLKRGYSVCDLRSLRQWWPVSRRTATWRKIKYGPPRTQTEATSNGPKSTGRSDGQKTGWSPSVGKSSQIGSGSRKEQ